MQKVLHLKTDSTTRRRSNVVDRSEMWQSVRFYDVRQEGHVYQQKIVAELESDASSFRNVVVTHSSSVIADGSAVDILEGC